MADEELITMLKRNVAEWNGWRVRDKFQTRINIGGADFEGLVFGSADLSQIDSVNTNFRGTRFLHGSLYLSKFDKCDFRNANLMSANFRKSSLKATNFSSAKLEGSKFSDADLSNSDLRNTNLRIVDFRGSNLFCANFENSIFYYAKLNEAYLHRANLSNISSKSTDFYKADLSATKIIGATMISSEFNSAILHGATLKDSLLEKIDFRTADFKGTKFLDVEFKECTFHGSIFINNDLRGISGLESSIHRGPSYIDSTTFKKSKGQIPKIFLEGCGLQDWEIKSVELYKEGLTDMEVDNIVYEVAQLRTGDSIQVHNLFISYSHANHAFVDAFEPYLRNKGIRFWRDIHDGTAGPLDKMVVRAMENRTVLLIFSENSINSDWVEFEVENARKLEKQYGRHVLCPIALDASWKDANWSPILMNQIKKYNVLDFSDWKNERKMGELFNRLLKGLDIFYKK